MAQARGLRNNNPLNIRRGQQWKGLRATQTDKEFAQFESLEYGIRAGFVTIKTYMTKYGIANISGIIYRWAPPKENNTARYLGIIHKRTGIAPYHAIKFLDKPKMCALVAAMAYVECGQEIPMDKVQTAYDMV